MGGGLLQLVAYGAQDAYLTGNPQITFWKGLFKRHTNFAMEPFRVNFSGQPNWGTKQTAIVGRHADLLFSTYVEVVLPKTYIDNTGAEQTYYWNNDGGFLGYNLIHHVELDVGGQVIDRLYSEFMVIWAHLTNSYDGRAKLLQMLNGGALPGASELFYGKGCAPDGRQLHNNVLYIPLPFFFTRNPGAALPLIALQYHEVKINVIWNDPQLIAGNFTNQSITVGMGPTAKNLAPIQYLPNATQASIYIDYIYLDTEERRRMAQASHEYLIEQTQFNEDKGIVGANNRIDLTFNHPVKELIWVVQPSEYTNCKIAAASDYDPDLDGTRRLTPFTYDLDPVFDQWIQINGQDRLDRRFGDYYNKVQAFQHHSGVMPGIGVYSYSFAVRPEEHQPSGSCNFSRIDTATIVMNMAGLGSDTGTPSNPNINKTPDYNNWDVRVYAVNYNVLRVMSGMGGLAYSN
jgi:hypothetical protein